MSWARLVVGCIVSGVAVAPGLSQTRQSSDRTAPSQVAAATRTVPPVGYASVVQLWEAAAPGAVGTEDADVPKLFCYPANGTVAVPSVPPSAAQPGSTAGSSLKTAVIVMPGGGYKNLVMEKEGAAAARWLNAHGVTALVLEYRLGPRYGFPVPMLDGARAVRYVRSHAEELGVRPDAVGLWGFSAGAHLAGYLATTNDSGDITAADPVERVSDRPDFVVLAYGRFSLDASVPRPTSFEPLIGEHPSPEIMEKVWVTHHVTALTPPSFIYSTTADQTVNSLNSTEYYDAMKRAGAPVEMHIFEAGPHGTGMGQGLKGESELEVWPALAAHWMALHGWMASE